MTKTYSMKQLGKILHWLSGSQLHKFLEAQGIRPSSELQMGNRTYRQYDEAALTKCKELSEEHARKKSDAQLKATPTESEDVLHTLHTLLKATDLLIQAVGNMQPKLADLAHRVTVASIAVQALDAKLDTVAAAVQDLAKNSPAGVFDDDTRPGHFDFSRTEAA
jgi:hypothetical protein